MFGLRKRCYIFAIALVMHSVIKMRERCLPFLFLPLSFSSALPSGILFFSDASLFVFVKVYYFLFSQLSIFTHNLPFLLINLFLHFCLPFNSRETLLGAGLALFSFRPENDFFSLSLLPFHLFMFFFWLLYSLYLYAVCTHPFFLLLLLLPVPLRLPDLDVLSCTFQLCCVLQRLKRERERERERGGRERREMERRETCRAVRRIVLCMHLQYILVV